MKFLLSFCFENAYAKLMNLYRRSNRMDVTLCQQFASWMFYKASLQISHFELFSLEYIKVNP